MARAKWAGLNCAVDASRFSIRCSIVSRRTVDSVILCLQLRFEAPKDFKLEMLSRRAALSGNTSL